MQQFSEFFFNHWDLFLVAAFLTAMLIWQSLRGRFAGYQEIDSGDAVGLINREDAVLLDVREESEYKGGHVANALHIPLGALKGRLNELEKHKTKPVIIMCRSGHRSAQACGTLVKNGFPACYNLKGGIGAWQNAGLPVTRGGKPKKR